MNMLKKLSLMMVLAGMLTPLCAQQGAAGDTKSVTTGVKVEGEGNIAKSKNKTVTNTETFSGWQGTQQVIAGNEIEVSGIRMFSAGNDVTEKKLTEINTNIAKKTIDLNARSAGLPQSTLDGLLARVNFNSLGALYQSYATTNKQVIMFDMPTKSTMVGFSFTPTQGDFAMSPLTGRYNNLTIKIAIGFVSFQGSAAQLAVYRNVQGSDEWELVATPLVPLTNTNDLAGSKLTISDILPNGNTVFFNIVNGKEVTQTIALGNRNVTVS